MKMGRREERNEGDALVRSSQTGAVSFGILQQGVARRENFWQNETNHKDFGKTKPN
jgi:hypothetical protein